MIILNRFNLIFVLWLLLSPERTRERIELLSLGVFNKLRKRFDFDFVELLLWLNGGSESYEWTLDIKRKGTLSISLRNGMWFTFLVLWLFMCFINCIFEILFIPKVLLFLFYF